MLEVGDGQRKVQHVLHHTRANREYAERSIAMQKGRAYVTGLILTIIGGTGLACIEVDSDLLFWIYAIVFSIGFTLCIAGYKDE